jgi:hypothetical protein
MTHPLVTQLRFTRSEWIRGLEAVTTDEAARRFGPINPIAWMVGHLAWQEQLYWLERAQGNRCSGTRSCRTSSAASASLSTARSPADQLEKNSSIRRLTSGAFSYADQ